DHDATLLMVLLLAGATAGVTVALIASRHFGEANRSLQDAAARIGRGDLGARVALNRPATAELSALARELDLMSQRLAAARAHEDQLDASRRELIAWLSHDLRTPLAGILAISEALHDGVVSDPTVVSRYLETLQSEARRLDELVDDLFELSLLDAGTPELS